MGILFLLLLLLPLFVAATTTTTTALAPRPPAADDARVARWLVNQTNYGVLTTMDYNGFPFGNVVSHADGGSGTPYFFLATKPERDPTGPFALNNSRASFTVSEASLGLCGSTDKQSPDCTKITLVGDVRQVGRTSPRAKFGREAVFTGHPSFSRWPVKHRFGLFVLDINRIFLINGFKPYVDLSVSEYYAARQN